MYLLLWARVLWKEWSSTPSQQKSSKCSTRMQSQKWGNNLCSFPRQTMQQHSNPNLYPNHYCWRSQSWMSLWRPTRPPESEVAQSCPTLCDPMDCSPPGSSVHGIHQARILEWIAISFSRGSSQPRDRTQVSHIVGRCFNLWASRKTLRPPELTPKKDVLFIIGDCNAKVGSQEIPGVTGKFGLGLPNEAEQRLTEYCQENTLVIANTLNPTIQEKTLHVDITRWSIPKSDWLYSLEPKMEKLYIVKKKKRLGTGCGSDYELLIAKFRLKLKKLGENH